VCFEGTVIAAKLKGKEGRKTRQGSRVPSVAWARLGRPWFKGMEDPKGKGGAGQDPDAPVV
jgi:hypothetical protein